MSTSIQKIKLGWLLVCGLAILFFKASLFDNVVFEILVVPIWAIILYTYKELRAFGLLVAILAIYGFIHNHNFINQGAYFENDILLCCVLTVAISFYYILKHNEIDLDLLFRNAAILNFMLVAFSIIVLFIPFLQNLLWYTAVYTNNLKSFPRLKLFSPDPSAYAASIAPIAIYFYSRIFFGKTKHGLLTFVMVTAPLILTLSLGVLAAISLSGLVILRVYYKEIANSPKRTRNFFLLTILTSAVIIAIAYLFPNNPLSTRIYDVFKGYDASGKVKTFQSFIMAKAMLAQNNLLWGMGPGQIDLSSIPNAAAQTIVCFGYIGLAIRLIVEVALFFKTKVYQNPYRLWLFLFVFAYQFSGSYLTNIVEYIVWVLAFSPVFSDFINNSRRTFATT